MKDPTDAMLKAAQKCHNQMDGNEDLIGSDDWTVVAVSASVFTAAHAVCKKLDEVLDELRKTNG